VENAPKNLFTYWHQGFSKAPAIVWRCKDSFLSCNPNWRCHFLDAESVWDWIDPIPISRAKWNGLGMAHQSDLIRTQLLIRYGGVWSDPTVLFRLPLSEWLPKLMGAGIFMFQRPGPDRWTSNWFIASEKGHPLLIRQFVRLCRYWSDIGSTQPRKVMVWRHRAAARVLNRNLEWPRLWTKPWFYRLAGGYPYMIYHYMLYDLVRSDPELGDLLAVMPRFSADLPHLPAVLGLLDPISEESKVRLEQDSSPVYKLSWKLPAEDVPAGSVLDHIMNSCSGGSPVKAVDAGG